MTTLLQVGIVGLGVAYAPERRLHGFVRARTLCDGAQADQEAMVEWLRTSAR